MKIAVAGTGYVGLSLATLLSLYFDVIAVDIIEEKVNKINNRISPIDDNGIIEFFKNRKLNLTATTDSESAYKDAEYIIIAVPTNYDENTNYFDTHNIEDVLDVVEQVNKDAVVVIKSTIPVGYTKSLYKRYKDLTILFSPEFLREGTALIDNLFPSRIIVGYNDISQIEVSKKFAEILNMCARSETNTVLFMSTTEAEAVKLFANTYLAMRVSYFNELDNFCIANNLSAENIIDGICADKRIGTQYNNPSFGYGGYCLPKDTKQLLANYSEIPQTLIKAIVESNTIRKNLITDDILHTLNYSVDKSYTIGIYKLAMKANSDNYRKSAILDIMDNLHMLSNIKVIVYEPSIKADTFDNKYDIIHNLEEFKEKSDIIVTNRKDSKLNDIIDKLYTRDIYSYS